MVIRSCAPLCRSLVSILGVEVWGVGLRWDDDAGERRIVCLWCECRSKQRTRKFVTKILRKTSSSLAKIISDGENNFTQNKYNKLQKRSAKNKCFFLQKISAKVQIWDHLQFNYMV